MNRCHFKLSFYSLFFVVLFIFSSSANSTQLDLSTDSFLLGDPGSYQTPYDQELNGGDVYKLIFDFPDLNIASNIVLSFNYGLLTASMSESIDISPSINGKNLGTFNITDGYYFPGYKFESLVLDNSFLNEKDNVFLIESMTSSNTLKYLIGDVKLTYNTITGNVPVPATLLLMLLGLSGIFYTRVNKT